MGLVKGSFILRSGLMLLDLHQWNRNLDMPFGQSPPWLLVRMPVIPDSPFLSSWPIEDYVPEDEWAWYRVIVPGTERCPRLPQSVEDMAPSKAILLRVLTVGLGSSRYQDPQSNNLQEIDSCQQSCEHRRSSFRTGAFWWDHSPNSHQAALLDAKQKTQLSHDQTPDLQRPWDSKCIWF